ncbi:hypothetical protein FJZ19_03610 [Candidatus Pacearchaeota archaeon]|nr:hypothetical protein [Candidatus Pacearchaeota archaeon]
MKIKVFYDKDSKQLRVPVIVKIPHKRISSDFVIDTGSPHTILNYSNSLRLGVPHTEKAELIRLGGRAYQSYLFNRTEIVFKSEDNKEINEIISARILKPSSPKAEEIEMLDRCPNLLGIDFLEKGWKFFCNLEKDEVYFEKID